MVERTGSQSSVDKAPPVRMPLVGCGLYKGLSGEVWWTHEEPVGHGGFGAVFAAEYRSPNNHVVPVAVKSLHGYWQAKVKKRIEREVKIWSTLSHPSLLLFLGTCQQPGSQTLILVSPFMRNGNALAYLSANRKVDRAKLLAQVAAGLLYLHTPSEDKFIVLHGDIKAENVLISDSGTALLADFGLSIAMDEIGQDQTLSKSYALGGTERFKAPELILEDDSQKSIASDIWAFGMLICQMHSGEHPFMNHKTIASFIRALGEERRPERPSNCRDDAIWALAQECWAQQPSDRPSTLHVANVLQNVCGGLESLSINLSIETTDSSITPPHNMGQSPPAERKRHQQVWMPLAWKGRADEVVGRVQLSRRKPIGYGRYSLCFEGIWVHDVGDDNSVVDSVTAKKRKALPFSSNAKESLRLLREVKLWSKLDHRFLLPLLGTCDDHGALLFVMPYMKNGSIIQYLCDNPTQDRLVLLQQVAEALLYLHTVTGNKNIIIHGDIKGDNVLVSDTGQAQLAGFALSLEFDEDESLTSSVKLAGTERFKAPELLLDDDPRKTTATDVYAFGMLIYQVYSGNAPFNELTRRQFVASLAEKQRPSRPANCTNDAIWQLVTECWAHDAATRPSMKTVLMNCLLASFR